MHASSDVYVPESSTKVEGEGMWTSDMIVSGAGGAIGLTGKHIVGEEEGLLNIVTGTRG